MIKLFEIDGTERQTLKGHAKAVKCLAFSDKGKALYSGSSDGTVRCWDVASGLTIRKLDGASDDLISLGVSAQGQQLAAAANDPVRPRLEPRLGRAFSPARRASGAGLVGRLSSRRQANRDGQRRQDRATPRPTKRKGLAGSSRALTAALYSPDGKFVLTAGGDAQLRLYDAVGGQEVRRFEGHSAAVTAAVFAAGGKQIISGGIDRQVRIWNAADGKQITVLPNQSAIVTSLAVSPEAIRN